MRLDLVHEVTQVAFGWHGYHLHAFETVCGEFGLRLTPPLATVPDAAEIVVTGPATQARATVPVHPAGS